MIVHSWCMMPCYKGVNHIDSWLGGTTFEVHLSLSWSIAKLTLYVFHRHKPNSQAWCVLLCHILIMARLYSSFLLGNLDLSGHIINLIHDILQLLISLDYQINQDIILIMSYGVLWIWKSWSWVIMLVGNPGYQQITMDHGRQLILNQ